MRHWRILHGDCIEKMRELEAESIDASVTDGPYGLGFMGREWDTFKPGTGKHRKLMHPRERALGKIISDNPNINGRSRSPALSPSQIEYDYSVAGLRRFQAFTEEWGRELIRVLKPGAYVLSCGAPRAYHRMACGLEDAGFVVRDSIAWLFGSGFPKNLNLGDGKGTALKPAHEPIVLAWKPFKGSITKCHEQHGTAALNIEACRVGDVVESWPVSRSYAPGQKQPGHCGETQATGDAPNGRWPANVTLDEEAAAELDRQTGELVSGFMAAGTEREGIGYHGGLGCAVRNDTIGDRGGASRFYYVAKPSREERDFGIFDLERKSAGECTDRADGSAGLNNPRAGAGRTGGGRNFHPTVKPVELMRWLVRLVTPVGGTVLDPFMGSGTTGMACRYENRSFIGIEREAEYIAIAERRIHAVAPLFSPVDSDQELADGGYGHGV